MECDIKALRVAVVAPVAVVAIGVLISLATGAPASTASTTSPADIAAPTQEDNTLRGSMTIVGVHGGDNSVVTVEGNRCYATGGFSDVNTGASVTVYDATGRIVATGSLGEGVGRKDMEYDSGIHDIYVGYCEFPFQIEVPGGDFYQVEISHRGRSTVSRDDMHDVRLSLST